MMADKLIWTELTDLYLAQNTYESYEIVLRRPCQELAAYIRKYELTPEFRDKLALRLVQMMNFREVGEEMIK